jgi:hypothetical protein
VSFFLKGILPAKHCFQSAERLIFFQIGLFSRGDESHVSLLENHVCWRQEHQAHYFPVIIEVFLKEYILQIRIFKVEKGSSSST